MDFYNDRDLRHERRKRKTWLTQNEISIAVLIQSVFYQLSDPFIEFL